MKTEATEVVIIGAGPAGIAAAKAASNNEVVVLDEQAMPGGQIWRSLKQVEQRRDLSHFGNDYRRGLNPINYFLSSNVDYRPEARVIGVEETESKNGGIILYLHNGSVKRIAAKRLIIAVGAQERSMPFPGWTLPGVITAGAAQIALKTADLVPKRPFVLAGQGPLFLLILSQLKAVGIQPDVLLRLDNQNSIWKAIPHLPGALAGAADLAKGIAWRLNSSFGTKTSVANVISIEAHGKNNLERVTWKTLRGKAEECSASSLLIHDGVVPNTQLLRSMRTSMWYDKSDASWRPKLVSIAGQLAEKPWVFVAGDAAGIGGWKAASAMGSLAGAAVSHSLKGNLSVNSEELRKLGKARASRPFLNALYPPAKAFTHPKDSTIVCRCEAVSAGEIRDAVKMGAQGPNQLKAFLRCGMGPCQGRICADMTAAIIAQSHGKKVGEVEPMRVRMPISPVTLGEMASSNY